MKAHPVSVVTICIALLVPLSYMLRGVRTLILNLSNKFQLAMQIVYNNKWKIMFGERIRLVFSVMMLSVQSLGFWHKS